MEPTPFTPALPDRVLDDLRARLRNTRWPHVIGEDTWDYGVPQSWLQEMVQYWAEKWDWSAQAAEMNRFEHFRVELDGIPIHFLRALGKGPSPTPLILTHGWPWTFWDFKQVIEPLSDPASHGGDPGDSFDVIVPSLPGFGFSTPLETPGLNIPRVADLWVRLMRDVLGYERFAAHGGDWGAMITAHLGHAHANRLIGVHMSLPVVPGLGFAVPKDAFAEDEKWMVARLAEATPSIRSHIAVHSRDPQTLAYAAADSPVGTAAWIWERRRNWSDCDGDVERAFDRDHLCTTAALYWCTGSFTSSMRLYYEHFKHPWQRAHDRSPVIEAPTAYAIFPKELLMLPRRIAQEQTNLHRWTVYDRGGHFAAAENPQAIVADIRAFLRELR